MTGPLPIDAILPDVLAALHGTRNVVLHAPPGAGKTTRVPLALLSADWLSGTRIVMLEPRRLAARAAAGYMSTRLDEDVGGTIGYRVRLDSRVGPRTRVEVVTEGVLTRMLHEDPSLDGVGIVIFDEFHERSIHADTGLALTLQTQALLRPELRILVMSATLDAEALHRVLPEARVITSEGRAFPVETVYLSRPVEGAIEGAVARAVSSAHERHAGDILAFLPGAAEIRRTAERVSDLLPRTTRVIQLYGDLPREEQDRAIAPSPRGMRKLVLATSIAETSLTIEGVRVVIDSGLMRVPRFSPRTGMTRLATVAVTRAAADQRRGRAGRVAEGTCYRLWTEQQHGALLAQRPPEILEADLAPLALDLALWGIADPTELRWIDEPPAAAFRQARELLRELRALDDAGTITVHGRAIAALPLHPRLAHMLVAAQPLHATAAAADLAALLGERDILRAHGAPSDPDLRLRLPLLHGTGSAPHGHSIERGALQRVRADARHLRRRMHVPAGAHSDDDTVGLLLALAYPDRIGQLRTRGRFQLRNGAVALIDTAFPLAGEPMIAVASVGGHGRETRVYMAAPVPQPSIEREFQDQIEQRTSIDIDEQTLAVRATEQRMLGALVLSAAPLRDPQAGQLDAALLDAVRRRGLAVLPWREAARKLRQRLAFLHAHDETWPDVADETLLDTLESWLGPWLGVVQRSDVLRNLDLTAALLGLVGWDRRALLDRLAPTHMEVPSGSRIAIDYSDSAAPVLAVRLQEMFGATDTPRIADGRVPLTLHLLSPAHRPVQVTRDLASFWRAGYFAVRRDLRGRYPKHYWPDDPLTAEPTRRARPR